MFEKSLYDLIRGLRNHKGNEREYIQESLRECRREIKSQDMDLKATALLKLVYLEMFGHDMSWAAFNVLEVMSSPKHVQKRVGYLGAVQSFRPDTEVLMLAENLLKKDLNSATPLIISLPIGAIPHLISPSMASSLLQDILPRLTHSHAAIRKKTIVTLYRLALVYPETLRPAWPKIKERLLDDSEDPSVTAAVVNVVCELGWRRPQDFLPLAPRLFDLLVDGNNNWMAIKIIKLFAHLTPLEPRLVKKLLPPLTTIIKTTPAMSLLYECINGIIQGGILDSVEGSKDGEEIARLCVSKLRGMLVIEGDPNLKYVSLLAFGKIVQSHPYLVSEHEDVILECVDNPDISIRLRALELVVGMVNVNNLMLLVGRLLQQLRNSPTTSLTDDPLHDRGLSSGIQPTADSDSDDAEQSIRPAERRSQQMPPLPDEYRTAVIQKILDMCSQNTYANISNFDWYIDILVQLVRHVPSSTTNGVQNTGVAFVDMACSIGGELRNVAIRVKSSRKEATQAAESLVSTDRRAQLFPPTGNGGSGVLESSVWIVGEYPQYLRDADSTLASLLHSSTSSLPAPTLCSYVQAIIKVFSLIACNEQQAWTPERRTMILLLLAKIEHFLDPLTKHSYLEIQERSVEYLELIRLATEAAKAQNPSGTSNDYAEPPLLLTQAIPALFQGLDLKPVARDAQRKVPIPEGLDLDMPINENLNGLLVVPDIDRLDPFDDEFHRYYNEPPQVKAISVPAASRLEVPEPEFSYQQSNGSHENPETVARRQAQRRERYKDDPFYIPSEEGSKISTPMNNVLKTHNGEELDVDAIPIMELDLEGVDQQSASGYSIKPNPIFRRHFDILGDEGINDGDGDGVVNTSNPIPADKRKKNLLQLDSSGLGSLSLNGDGVGTKLDVERREAEEAEIARAMKEVERLRLEMQRASERIEDTEGTLVKSKKKKKKTITSHSDTQAAQDLPQDEVKKKKKKKKPLEAENETKSETAMQFTAEPTTVKKTKKRRQINFESEDQNL